MKYTIDFPEGMDWETLSPEVAKDLENRIGYAIMSVFRGLAQAGGMEIDPNEITETEPAEVWIEVTKYIEDKMWYREDQGPAFREAGFVVHCTHPSFGEGSMGALVIAGEDGDLDIWI